MGFTPRERLEGLHFEFADWHGANKALEVSTIILITTKSTVL